MINKLIFFIIFVFSAMTVSPVMAGAVIRELSIRDMDISEALSLISQKSGLNIIAGSGAQGKVTVFLRDVDALEALKIVVESSGLALSEEGSIIRVMTQADYQARYGHAYGQEKITRILKLNFVPIEQAGALLNEMRSPDGKIIANPQTDSVVIIDTLSKVRAMEAFVREMDVQTETVTLPLHFARMEEVLEKVRGLVGQTVGRVEGDIQGNKLIVTDTLANVEKIRRAVEELDARGRKVILQAKLVHIVLNDEHLNGVDWEGIVSDFRKLKMAGKYDFLNVNKKEVDVSLGTIAENEFSLLIEALDTVGLAREYPVVDVAIRPEDEARLILNMDDPDLQLSIFKTSLRFAAPDPGVRSRTALEFFIKPVVSVDGSVTVNVEPHEASGVKKVAPALVGVDSGAMLIMGNLIATEKVLIARRVPLIGDVPLLGFAFRYHNKSIRREEFVIFLTPKVAPREEASEVIGVPIPNKDSAGS